MPCAARAAGGRGESRRKARRGGECRYFQIIKGLYSFLKDLTHLLLISTKRGIAELKLFLSCGASLQSLLAHSFRSPISPFSYNTLMAEAARYVSLMWVFAEKRGLAEKLA